MISDFIAQIHFNKFKESKLVEITDSEGRIRKCIMFPLEVNGIKITENKNVIMNVGVVRNQKLASSFMNHGTHLLVPRIEIPEHEELIAKGLLNKNDRHWSKFIGSFMVAPRTFERKKKE